MTRIAVILCALLLIGCGSDRDTQTKTVERMTTTTGPVIVDTPIGQFTAQPIRHEMTRSEDSIESQQTRLSMPEAGQVISAVAGGSPWGPIVGGVGMLVAAFAGKKAIDANRQRNEITDSITYAKDSMPPDVWDTVKGRMAEKQSADTQAAVKRRKA